MKIEECKPGVRVLYEPSPGRKFRGIIAAPPRNLASLCWVTVLRDMEPAYGEFAGKKGAKAKIVYAASLSRIEVADD